MLHPTTTTIVGAAARRTLSTMPHRLRSTCPRGTRIATVRSAKAPATATPATTMTSTANGARLFHRSRTQLGSTKEDHMDRERLNPSSTEYSKSGSDDDAAKMGDAAFNPDKTSPEEALGTAEAESGEVRQSQRQSSQDPNPLDVSPGNRDVSASKDPKHGGPDRSPSESGEPSSRSGTSRRGSPAKHGDGKTGGGGVH